MPTITRSNKDNFLLWEKVNGVLPLAELQASGLPDRPNIENELVGGFIYSVTVSALETISLPMYNLDDSLYDFTVNFSDLTGNKSVSAYADSDREHAYAEAGTYDITIVGQFDYIKFADSPNSIIQVKAWGDAKIGGSSFLNCVNLTTISATDIPLMHLTSLSAAFAACSQLSVVDDSINDWDISVLTDINQMFSGASLFNKNLSNWDTSNVTLFIGLFANSAFNQDIGGWDITSLTDAAGMFTGGSLSTTNYDLLLVGWESQVELTGVVFSAGGAKYSAGAPATARGVLDVTSSWVITDGGPA